MSTMAGRKQTPPPHCSRSACCLRDRRRRCSVLTDNDFGGRECPFFKTAAQRDAEEERNYQRLVALGRDDLILKYHIDEQRKARARRRQHDPE